MRKFDYEIGEIVTLWGLLMDQNCLEMLLVLTHPGSRTYTFSNLLSQIFLSRCQSIGLNLKRNVRFKHLETKFLHQSWNPGRPEVAKVLSPQTYLEVPSKLSRKLHPWILVSTHDVTLWYYYMTLTLINFCFFFEVGSNFSIKISIDNCFLSLMRFIQKTCCIFNLLFLGHLDEK